MKFLNKRIMTTALAGAMALSLAVPALAEETVIEGAYKEIVIDVVVPAEGTAQINPYALPVDITKKGGGKETVVGQQIVTQPLSIKNKMDVDLDVYATVSGKAKGLTLATAAPASTSKEKEAFVYLQMMESASTGAEGDTLNDAIITEFAAWDQAYDADKDVIVKEEADEAIKMATLKAAEMDTNDAFKAYQAGSIALVRLAGDVVKKPETAWSESDNFTAKVAYTFEPAATTGGGGATTSYTITKGTLTGNDDGGDISIDKTTAAENDTVTVTVTPDSTNTNVTVTVTDADSDPVTVTPGATNVYTFTMPAKNVTVTATFAS